MSVLFALVCVSLLQDDASVSVEREWRGGKTEIAGEEYHRITDSDAWASVWRRHTGNARERAPEVDFEKQMVVACFLGPVSYDEVAFYGARRTRNELVFGLMVSEEDCCDFSKSPSYYIAVLPRCELKVTIISRVQRALDVDPRKDQLLCEIPAITP